MAQEFHPDGTATPDLGTQFPTVNMYREPDLAQEFRDFMEALSGPLAFTHQNQAPAYVAAIHVDGDRIGVHIPFPLNPSQEYPAPEA